MRESTAVAPRRAWPPFPPRDRPARASPRSATAKSTKLWSASARDSARPATMMTPTAPAAIPWARPLPAANGSTFSGPTRRAVWAPCSWRSITSCIARWRSNKYLEKHADDDGSRQRFVAEAEITGALEHPGVVPVYGLGTDAGGRPYYAMRFIKGDSLKEAIARFHDDQALKTEPGRRSLELRKLLRRFTDVCNAIDYAHSRGVIHRDIKPANIIVGKHGETLVVDWGLAKAIGRAEPSVGEETIAPSSSGSSNTLPGSALGTPAYMSPEQARGELYRLGPRSDVYSLGATLYCLLTGKPPFEGEDIGIVLRAVQEGHFRRPSQNDSALDKALEAICLKAMAKEPEDRYPAPRALADDLERWMADEPVSAWRDPLWRQVGRWGRRNRTAVTAVAVAVLAALVGTAAVLAVQTRANADLSQANIALAAAKDREAARFGLALEAIKLFHGEVGDDLVLKADQFKPLRDKLLRGAADFYGKLEELLTRHPDRASRRTMGNAYFELGGLIAAIGDKPAALAVHHKALAVRRDLASEPAANDLARGDVAKSLYAIASLLRETGKMNEALTLAEEARDLLEGMPVVGPGTDGRRDLLGMVYARIGSVLENTGKTAAAMSALQRSVETLTRLAGDNPSGTDLQSSLARTYNDIALLQAKTGKPAEALESHHLRWRSTRNWLATIPRTPSCKAARPAATATSAFCWRRPASRPRRWSRTGGRWRSTRSWPTTTRPSRNSGNAWRTVTTTSAFRSGKLANWPTHSRRTGGRWQSGGS